jgi:hypothetical protein
MDFKRHHVIHSRLDGAKDEILTKVRRALDEAGLHDFTVGSIGLCYKRPPRTCGPNEELVWGPIATSDDDTVIYGWVCKPRTW